MTGDVVEQLEVPHGQDEVVPRRVRVDLLGKAVEPDTGALAAQAPRGGRNVDRTGLVDRGELSRDAGNGPCAKAEVLGDALNGRLEDGGQPRTQPVRPQRSLLSR